MTHLGLGSLEEPWGCLAGVCGIVAFPGGGVYLLGGLGGQLPNTLPHLRLTFNTFHISLPIRFNTLQLLKHVITIRFNTFNTS